MEDKVDTDKSGKTLGGEGARTDEPISEAEFNEAVKRQAVTDRADKKAMSEQDKEATK